MSRQKSDISKWNEEVVLRLLSYLFEKKKEGLHE